MPGPAVTHEAQLEMIRRYPNVAVDLVQAASGVRLPEGATAALGPTSLNAVVPEEFAADVVVVVTDPATGKPVLVIVVEPQGRDVRADAYAWPAYLAIVREAVQCPAAVLIVVCPDFREAEKCRQVTRMGCLGWGRQPVTLDPLNPHDDGAHLDQVLFLVGRRPTVDMTTEAGARRVLGAIRDADASRAGRKHLSEIILKSAGPAAREILEAMMKADEWKDDFIESYVKVGVDQGREEGREVGAAEKAAKNLLKVLDARGLNPTKEQRAKATADAGLAKLDRWFDRALTAVTADEVFKDDAP